MSGLDHDPQGKAKYIMVGGFLGAGKTTTVGRLAEKLTAEGKRVGLITNDQGAELVDTATLRSKGFATEEIAGGCFCCRFDSLTEAATKLTQDAAPDIFIAEPVGSCTDLVATVSYPLRRIYGNQFHIAPMTTLVDPVRAQRILGLTEGRAFSPKVNYIYRKQLEEADIIVINKRETLSDDAYEVLRSALAAEYPTARIHGMSARTGDHFEPWVNWVTSEVLGAKTAMSINYDTYAEGEALLGWLNATLELNSPSGFDANQVLESLADSIGSDMSANEFEIAHLKMTLSPKEGLDDIAIINVVRNDFVPELAQRIDEPIESAQILLNLRGEADPAQLESIARSAVSKLLGTDPELRCEIEHLEQFRPGRPVPTHRIEEVY